MDLFLEKPSIKHKSQYEEMMDEWENYGGRINPGALRRYSNKLKANIPYEQWLQWIADDSDALKCSGNSVSQILFFLVNDVNRIIGATSIRPRLNESLINSGGHMGGGIRPSEREKGYATKMLALSLPIAKSLGINELLITCDKDNIASAKTIIKNGGVFDNEFIENDGNVVQRYWLKL